MSTLLALLEAFVIGLINKLNQQKVWFMAENS